MSPSAHRGKPSVLDARVQASQRGTISVPKRCRAIVPHGRSTPDPGRSGNDCLTIVSTARLQRLDHHLGMVGGQKFEILRIARHDDRSPHSDGRHGQWITERTTKR